MDFITEKLTAITTELAINMDIRTLPDMLKEFDADLRKCYLENGVEECDEDTMRQSAILGGLCSALGLYFLAHGEKLLSAVEDEDERKAIVAAVEFTVDQCGGMINELQSPD